MTKTDWIDGNLKPDEAGKYQRLLPSLFIVVSKYSGKKWLDLACIASDSILYKTSAYQDLKWRKIPIKRVMK